MNKIISGSIKDISHKISIGELHPSELCQSAIKLVHNVKSLNAYINITEKLANEQANESDKRQNDNKLIGKLDGIPIAIKDNFCTEGQLTTCGSLMLANFIPGYSATVYNRLRNNGAVLIGKTNLDQFGMGSGTIDSYYGPTKNIWGSELMTHYITPLSSASQYKKFNNDDWHIAGNYFLFIHKVFFIFVFFLHITVYDM